MFVIPPSPALPPPLSGTIVAGPSSLWPRACRRAYPAGMHRGRAGGPLVSILFLASLFWAAPIAAAGVPSGFTDAVFAGGLSNPTAMAFAPDGRLFVTQ